MGDSLCVLLLWCCWLWKLTPNSTSASYMLLGCQSCSLRCIGLVSPFLGLYAGFTGIRSDLFSKREQVRSKENLKSFRSRLKATLTLLLKIVTMERSAQKA